MPVCQAINPNLVLFDKPVIDTLYFSPLAFPENPYHRLVKDYKLVRDSLNDPLADAKLALTLFEDQWTAFQQQHAETGLLSFYHFAFSDNPTYTGLQLALLAMGAEPLNIDSAIALFQKLTRHKVCQTVFDSVLNTNIPDPGAARKSGLLSGLDTGRRRQFDIACLGSQIVSSCRSDPATTA